MRSLAALAALLLLSLAADASPGFYGFAGGAFIQGPASGSAIPNVVGQASSAAAGTVLTNAGFTLGTVTSKCSAAALNSVIEQDPTAGTSAAALTAVNVQTSTAVACVPHGGAGVLLKGMRMRGL